VAKRLQRRRFVRSPNKKSLSVKLFLFHAEYKSPHNGEKRAGDKQREIRQRANFLETWRQGIAGSSLIMLTPQARGPNFYAII
jgi:hypothetical protein